ncbi:methyltransferase domain-containing protein [Shimazuella sp. AN120528]|uniref:class I SAM-dependent methyltransferase n=1 Tax=Shimazuella soli TaxID=1892854 RepID=UPI001F0D0D9C|nr:class I SAM-dependent methyltransferase [Shimazuella soli]MCH5586341.1 methyltransferase domain-containing protein [Shimazuella soli]
MENHLQYDPTLFQGTASYYSSYRFPYPEELFQHIVQSFHLDKNSQVLDLGCGTGNLSIPLASYCQNVIGMDPDPEMLREAKRLATLNQVENLELVLGSSWDISNDMGPFQATIMGESFHWMDRDGVLNALYDVIASYGGIAIVSKKQIGPSGYQEVVDQVIKEFLGEKRKAGKGFYSHPTERHEVVLSRSRFSILEPYRFEYQVEKTIEDLIGFLYSTSYANKRLLGDEVENFEKELRQGLISVGSSGKLSFQVTVTALMGRKDGKGC